MHCILKTNNKVKFFKKAKGDYVYRDRQSLVCRSDRFLEEGRENGNIGWFDFSAVRVYYSGSFVRGLIWGMWAGVWDTSDGGWLEGEGFIAVLKRDN